MTKVIYHTDTPQDTAFRDKLFDAASERVNLAGMSEGQFEVIDILPEGEQKRKDHAYGPMQYKFTYNAVADICIIYPVKYFGPESAMKLCKEHGSCESFKRWELAKD